MVLAWPVWYNSLQSRYEVWYNHIDALQVSTEERGRIKNDGGQDRSTDVIRDLETLNEHHVEPVGQEKKDISQILFQDLTQRSDIKLGCLTRVATIMNYNQLASPLVLLFFPPPPPPRGEESI